MKLDAEVCGLSCACFGSERERGAMPVFILNVIFICAAGGGSTLVHGHPESVWEDSQMRTFNLDFRTRVEPADEAAGRGSAGDTVPVPRQEGRHPKVNQHKETFLAEGVQGFEQMLFEFLHLLESFLFQVAERSSTCSSAPCGCDTTAGVPSWGGAAIGLSRHRRRRTA